MVDRGRRPADAPIVRLIAVLAASGLCALAAACSSGTDSANASKAGGAQTRPSPPALPPGQEWAAWINRDVELNLQNLPHDYTCDALWYRFHAILLAIGAREYMSIESYDCGKGAGLRSPHVHLKFLTLQQVTGDQIRWANTRAIEKTVVLAPGEPKRLEPADCNLVQQVKDTLFAYLNMPVSAARFECTGPTPHFELSGRVLVRWPEQPIPQ